MDREQVLLAYMATGQFAAAVACILAEGPADAQTMRAYFDPLFKLHTGIDPLTATRAEVKRAMLDTARKCVELLEGMK